MEDNKQLNQEEYMEIIEKFKKENKEDYEKGKIRKVFDENLIYSKSGRTIHWNASIGYQVYFIHENIEGWLKIINYDVKTRKLTIDYNNELFYIFYGDFCKGGLCAILGIVTVDFKIEIGQTFKDDKRDLTIINREYRKEEHIDKKGRKSIVNLKYYTYKCNKCGHKGLSLEGSLLRQKTGCACCNSSNRTVVLGINTIYDTDKWMIPYIGEECAKTHTHGSNKKVEVTCPDCGRIKNKPMTIGNIYKRHSIGCHYCSDSVSYPNKFAYELLNQLNKIYKFIYFQHEYSPSWLGQRRFDNYFIYNDKEYIIEMDGGLGHGKGNYKNNMTSEESKAIDDEKDRLAKEHNIEVIRIDCEISSLDYIKKHILESNLNKLFDLSKINWLKVEEFALSNLVKEACNLWDSGIHDTLKIAEIMKLSRPTITTYLKKGSKEVSWCEYNPNEESKKGTIQCKQVNKKPLEVFKDNISKGIFESASELIIISEKLFGVKFDFRKISLVCLGKQKKHKGYTFKYIMN
jgi:predicted RNA-binding Zn-ribbon protein involved in translation (DUF1610 family)